MATGMFGAHPDELRAVGGEFGVAAGLLDSSAATVGSEIAGVRWLGPDAMLYRANWGTVLPSQLSELGGVLEIINTDLDRQAGDQEDASQPGNGNEGCANSIGNGLKNAGNAIGGFFKGLLVDGIWEDIKGLGALVGIDENGWSWETMKNTWRGMGGLVGFDQDGNWSLGTLGNTWKEVGKDFLAWDMWKTDPAAALGKVTWNIGSMFIGVGEAKMLAKAGAVSDAGRVANVAADAGRVADVAADAGRVADVADAAADAGRIADTAGDAGRIADTAGDAGRIADTAGDAGRLADTAGDAGRLADTAGDAARLTDDAPWAKDTVGAGRHADDAADAGRLADESGDAAADAGRHADVDPSTLERANRNFVNHGDPDFGRMEWNTKEGVSPDVVEGPRPDGGDARKMGLHQSHYDTGATINGDGNLVSTSGRVFTGDQVSHHWTSSTGKGNDLLMVGNGPEGAPFKPDHRYVLDSGKTVIETNEYGAPVYNRSYVDELAPKSKMYRGPATYADSSDWGSLNHGLETPNRGHGSGAGFRGPYEDINQIPQASYTNGTLQNNIEMAIREGIGRGDGPLLLERHTTFDTMQHASDPSRAVSGPPLEHRFTITQVETGEPWVPKKDGQPLPLTIEERFTNR
ncbi:hypothetical protein JRG19_07295 [Pseudoclavibacter alba]|uniref:hypothetical protein n=1 Tax=Pseudoclavibacter albus TaxID=272241 RepID=UPI0019CFA67D|nr:hypothetical protein [Pseudoclavibacter alba]MBN6778349.1 hypothetical protein [Pseudoclavibacter alba]